MEAIYDEDVPEILKSLEILDSVEQGEFECEKCEANISKSNIGKLYSEDGEIKFICDSIDCQ